MKPFEFASRTRRNSGLSRDGRVMAWDTSSIRDLPARSMVFGGANMQRIPYPATRQIPMYPSLDSRGGLGPPPLGTFEWTTGEFWMLALTVGSGMAIAHVLDKNILAGAGIGALALLVLR